MRVFALINKSGLSPFSASEFLSDKGDYPDQELIGAWLLVAVFLHDIIKMAGNNTRDNIPQHLNKPKPNK